MNHTDKIAHLAVNYAITISLPLLPGAITAAVASVGKEWIYDKWMGRGTFDYKDLVADAVGITMAVAYHLIFG